MIRSLSFPQPSRAAHSQSAFRFQYFRSLHLPFCLDDNGTYLQLVTPRVIDDGPCARSKTLPVMPHGVCAKIVAAGSSKQYRYFFFLLPHSSCLLPSKCAPSSVVHASMNLLLRLSSVFLNKVYSKQVHSTQFNFVFSFLFLSFLIF